MKYLTLNHNATLLAKGYAQPGTHTISRFIIVRYGNKINSFVYINVRGSIVL